MGMPARENLFVFDKQWDFLNHGAFGAVLEPLMHASHLLRYECERQPLKFFDRDLFSLVAYALQVMAHFVNCPATELYPLQNVTSGLNCVLQSIALQPGDEVICFSLTYGSTKKMLKDLCDRRGAKLCTIPLTLPVHSDESVVTALTNHLSSKTRLVIIDHITSNTALVLPTILLAAAARQAGALVVVDAAHALFSQPLSIYPIKPHTNNITSNITSSASTNAEETDNALSLSDVADVWLTNGHKWLSAPKGCAFMWAHPSVAPHLRPAIISHGFHSYLGALQSENAKRNVASDHAGEHSAIRKHNVRWWHESSSRTTTHPHQSSGTSKLLSSLVWDGCRDYTALLCTPLALDIWDRLPVGFDSALKGTIPTKLVGADSCSMQICRAYNRTILHSMVVPMLTREWKLREEDFAAPRSMRVDSPMVLVSENCIVQVALVCLVDNAIQAVCCDCCCDSRSICVVSGCE